MNANGVGLDQYSTRSEQLRASPPLLRSAILDRLTRVHWFVVPAMYGPAIGFFAALAFIRGGMRQGIVYMVFGYIVWTLTEYWFHRVLFHFEPEQGLGAKLHWMIHGVHHDHPNDPLRLAMPPVVSVPVAASFSLIFDALLPFSNACAMTAGFLTGYLIYDMTHFYLHHCRPRSRVGRMLRNRHLLHHFQEGYGVSAPWWDEVFRTSSNHNGKLKGSRSGQASAGEGRPNLARTSRFSLHQRRRLRVGNAGNRQP